MGGSNAKEKPKDKEKKDWAKTLRFIQTTLDNGATRLDLSNRHLKEFPDHIEGKKETLKWLSISHNELRSIPESVCQFVNLAALRVNGNQLSELPESLTTLTALQVLDLSKNKFEEWDPCIISMSQLTDLNLQCNQIGSLPDDFGSLSALKYLNLYINKIEDFNRDWKVLSSLTNLDLSFNNLNDSSLSSNFILPALTFLPLCGNKLTTIPDPILQLSNLKNLDLRFNQIDRLPDQLGPMASSLRCLKLCNNNLSSVPSSVSQLISLEEIDLSSNLLESLDHIDTLSKLTSLQSFWNKIEHLPDDFGNLIELKECYLTENCIQDLPKSLGKLSNLRTLMVNYNKISQIYPESLCGLSSLTVLNLAYNDISSLPDEIGSVENLSRLDVRANLLSSLPSTMKALSKLVALDIGDNGLQILPSVLFEIKSLTSLNAFSNGISSIPPQIAELNLLTSLNLSFNQLSVLPKEVGQLTAITHLRLDGNFFKEFPDCIFNLTLLKDLAIGSNRQIREIPANISQLGALQTFQASSNQIQILPDTFVQLKSLTELDLSHNRLVALPADLDSLVALTDLDISGNALTKIPACFGNMRGLQQVKASFNPGLSDVPPEYLKPHGTWISCTGNSKIEAEFYFSRKKTSDKSGRWQPTEEEDILPTIDHSALIDSTQSQISGAHSPSAQSLSPIASAESNENESSHKASEESDDKKKHKKQTSNSPKPSESKGKPKPGKSSDFHTPMTHIDDRRLTILPSDERDGEGDEIGSHPASTSNSSQGNYLTPKKEEKALNLSSGSIESKKKKDKKELKELQALLLDNNLVTRTPQVGWAEMRGSRPDMQDSLVIMENFQQIPEFTVLGLFDGHGGTETALLVAKKLPSLMFDNLKTILDARDLDFSLNSVLSLSHSDLHVFVRAVFMALHGAVAKAGYTDGAAATVALVCHKYGENPRSDAPASPDAWTTTNLNIIHGDEDYKDANIASWSEKGRAAQILLNTPPTSVTASTLTSDPSESDASRPTTSTPNMDIPSKKKGRSKALTGSGNSPVGPQKSLLVLGNCGDQRAVLCRKGRPFTLTDDHKPEKPSEIARINLSGGFVAESRRVNGLLALSRAIGDIGVQPHVTFEPDVMIVELTEHDEFLIMACDGVWDVLSSEQAVFLALAESSPSRAANRIREYAYSLGSTDNISVVVYQLKPRERTNFGTCLMTHVTESLHQQSLSPRLGSVGSPQIGSIVMPGTPQSGSIVMPGTPSPRTKSPRESNDDIPVESSLNASSSSISSPTTRKKNNKKNTKQSKEEPSLRESKEISNEEV